MSEIIDLYYSDNIKELIVICSRCGFIVELIKDGEIINKHCSQCHRLMKFLFVETTSL